MKRLVLLLLLLSLLLTGCGQEPEVPEAQGLDLADIPITLPEGVQRERFSDTQDLFFQDGTVIGGIAILQTEENTTENMKDSFGSTEVILDYIKENIIPGFEPERYDGYMMGSSPYGYFEVEVITLDGVTYHYLLEGANAYFDLWFHMEQVDARTRAGIVESIQSEELTVTGRAQFVDDPPADW